LNITPLYLGGPFFCGHSVDQVDGLPSMVMPAPAVTLTFWPNQYVSRSGTYVWWNYPQ